jgi:uracil-DNA glycosylase family 4
MSATIEKTVRRSANNETALRVLKTDWCDCVRCPLGYKAFAHVLYEAVPDHSRNTDVLFIGEGPGVSEDALGRPFVGPAGKLLKRTVIRAGGDDLRLVYTNLVACRPTPPKTGGNRPPSAEEVSACQPRLAEIIRIFRPKTIILLGKIPQLYAYAAIGQAGSDAQIVEVPHPSSLLHTGGEQSPNYPRYVASFEEAFDNVRRL